MHFQQNATNYHNIFTTKMHFITFNFKRQLNFTKILNVTAHFANFEIRGWVSDSPNLISCSNFLRVCAFFLTWTRAEKPLSQRCIVGNESNIRQASSELWVYSSPDPRKWHFMKNIMCWWIIPKITIGTVINRKYWLQPERQWTDFV